MTTQQSILIGKQFELNHFIFTIKEIKENGIVSSFKNKSGHQFPKDNFLCIEFLEKILKQLDLQPLNELEYE